MADNVTITQGSGTTVGADEIAAVKYQRVKLIEGADGVNDGDISSANPLPVELTDADGTAAADITAIKTAVEILDNAISGSEMQVDVVAPLPAGTNNIGDVDVLTQPARDRATDNIGAALQVDALMNDTTALTPKYAVIDAASSGDNTIVAAVAAKKIRVHAVWFIASAAVTARFEDGAAGTALTGQMQIAANGGFVLPFNPVGWFETTANTLLNLELSGAISVDGSLVYTEV